MRIHTNTLTAEDFRGAAELAGCGAPVLTEHGSRSRARAFELQASGAGRSGGQYGTTAHRTATWDEYGVILAELFRRDPGAIVAGVYESAEHFHWATGGRYAHLEPGDMCRHRWQYDGTAATGAYFVHRCRKCDAVRRFMAHGRRFGELAAAVSA